MEREFFYTELETLAFFNYHVTFPLLNAIENNSQAELCFLLPQLYRDLLEKKTDSLKNYVANMRHVKIQAPTSEVGNEIIGLMCIDAAKGILMQCGREYGFCEASDLSKRATDISLLTADEREGLPKNNLQAEGNHSIFNKRARRQQNVETLGLLANQ